MRTVTLLPKGSAILIPSKSAELIVTVKTSEFTRLTVLSVSVTNSSTAIRIRVRSVIMSTLSVDAFTVSEKVRRSWTGGRLLTRLNEVSAGAAEIIYDHHRLNGISHIDGCVVVVVRIRDSVAHQVPGKWCLQTFPE